MKWLDKLERKYRKFAIQGLMNYIVILTGIVFALIFVDRTGVVSSKLALFPSLVLRGEIWRLVTFIFIPPTRSLFFIIFTLYFYTLIGTSLENAWGSFRFNIFYLVGVLGTIAAAFITGQGVTAVYLNLSLFLAFAKLFPDFEILIFFVLPVKMRILAFIYWFFLLNTLIFYPLPAKIAALVSLLNYFLFFGRDIIKNTKRSYRVSGNRKRFQSKLHSSDQPIHRCTVCGITEKDDPEMEFRYCSKCEGDYEYCSEHLKNHQHIKK